MNRPRVVAGTLIALILALAYTAWDDVYWQRQYFNRNPFHIKLDVNPCPPCGQRKYVPPDPVPFPEPSPI